MRTRFMRRVIAALLALSAPAAAQPIVVEWQHGNDPLVSTLVAAGADVTINLDGDPTTPGIQPVFSDTFVRIHEAGTTPTVAPQFSVGSITINGTPDPFTATPRVSILIGASTLATIPDQPNEPIAPGLVSMGNSTSGIGLSITNSSLRAMTRVALSITGNTFGATEVGAVFHFEVNDTAYGNITATAINGALVTQNDFGQPFDPVQEFRAGNAILGHITATNGDIDSIIVFGTSATGIRGDIQAPNGHIRRVWTTGNIGTSTTTPKIWAGDGIDEIIAGTDTGSATPGAILDRDFNVNVDARVGNFYLTQLIEGPRFDGALADIRTDGDITGSIRAANLSNGPGVGGVHRGIIAGGVIAAPITIDLLLERADIIGSSITAPVWIGHRARGAIVASDVTSGVISGDSDPGPGVGYAVQIGFSTDPLPISASYDSHAPGFVGSNCGPLNVPSASVWYNPPSGRCLDQGSLDSVIRAVSIGRLRIANMFINGASTHVKEYIPRIEGQTIASIEIGNMREGVVWSGVWDAANTWTGPNEPENDYADVGDMSVTCVGPGADLWLQDTPLTVVFEDLLGEIYVPSLAPTERIIIGGRLGDAPDFGLQSPGDVCGECLDFPRCLNEKSREQDASPRGTGFADHGAIIVRDDLGLGGQIIINASNQSASAADLWKGRVVVDALATSPATPITLQPTALSGSQPDLAPYYARLSRDVGGDLGGGAVGLAPFHLHEFDSRPDHDITGIGDPLIPTKFVLEREFASATAVPVKIRSYGPIDFDTSLASNWAQAVEIHCRPLNVGAPDDCRWITVSDAFVVRGPGDPLNGEPNTIMLSRHETRYPRAGVYRVVSRAVVCKDVAGNPPVDWPDSCTTGDEPELDAYTFVIAPDCNNDNIDDRTQSGLNCNSNCHVADFNSSGHTTVQDLFDFLGAYFAGCIGNPPQPTSCIRSADVNASGSVTVQDIFDYLTYFFTCFQ